MRFDYVFLLTFSDIKTGRVVWDHEEIISKVADPSALSEIEQQNKAKQRERSCKIKQDREKKSGKLRQGRENRSYKP